MSTERHHATIFLPPDVAGPIEEARRGWDPVMAAQIAAHVTLAYPREVPSSDLLVQRLHDVGRTVVPFKLRLGRLGYHERPEAGAWCPLTGRPVGQEERLARPRNSA